LQPVAANCRANSLPKPAEAPVIKAVNRAFMVISRSFAFVLKHEALPTLQGDSLFSEL